MGPVGRSTARLTLDSLDRLPGHAASCLCWEFDPVHRERVRGHEAEEKAAWLSTVLREWGSCGRVVLVDDEPVGYALFAPAVFFGGAQRFATAPVSQDAVLLATAYVDPAYRGGGLGRILVQAMAKDLVRGQQVHAGLAAVEAFGSTGERDDCVLPVDFLLSVGFRTHRPHPRHPRMRMDLRTTVSWREEFEGAVHRLLGVVGKRDPVPDQRVSRGEDPHPKARTGLSPVAASRGAGPRPVRPAAR